MGTMADKFEELGVIPVVVLNDAKDALPLAKALYDGGLPCAEVTFRTAAAEESIRQMHEAYPDIPFLRGRSSHCGWWQTTGRNLFSGITALSAEKEYGKWKIRKK